MCVREREKERNEGKGKGHNYTFFFLYLDQLREAEARAWFVALKESIWAKRPRVESIGRATFFQISLRQPREDSGRCT